MTEPGRRPIGRGGAFYAVAAALAVLPILAARHLPLLDAQGHESRLAVLRDTLLLGHPSPFYRVASFFLPNIAFDVVGLALVGVVGPEAAGRLFFALTLLLTLGGVCVLNRAATGRWSLAPLAATLLLFNLVTVLGFFSYAFGFALVLWSLAGRTLLPPEQSGTSAIVTAVSGVVLLFCHVFDFGIYAVMVFALTAVELAERRMTPVQGLTALFGLAPAVILYGVIAASAGGGHFEFERNFLTAKLFGLVKSVTCASLVGDLAFVAGALLFALLMLVAKRARLARGYMFGVALLAILYLALPDKMATGSYVDKRMPVAILLIFIAGLDLRISRNVASAALVGLICLAVVVKQGALAILWQSFDPVIDAMATPLDALPDGAIVLQAECEPQSSSVLAVYRERQPSLTHVPAMAAFTDTRFVAATWAIAGQHTVAVRPEFSDYYDLQSSFGSSTCAHADYQAEYDRIAALSRSRKAPRETQETVFFLLIRPPEADPLNGRATMIAQAPTFTLYRVADAAPAAPAP